MKRLLIVFLLLSFVICLPACKHDKIEENPAFATYNAFFEKDFSTYVIKISATNASGDTLNEKYIVSTVDGVRSVSYRIERINQFTVEGDEITVPDDYLTVEEGIYSAAESTNEKFDIPKFNFSYECLGNSEVSSVNLYSTQITSIEKFMGLNLNVTDATVKLTLGGNFVESVTVSFVTEDNNTVEIKYTFN